MLSGSGHCHYTGYGRRACHCSSLCRRQQVERSSRSRALAHSDDACNDSDRPSSLVTFLQLTTGQRPPQYHNAAFVDPLFFISATLFTAEHMYDFPNNCGASGVVPDRMTETSWREAPFSAISLFSSPGESGCATKPFGIHCSHYRPL